MKPGPRPARTKLWDCATAPPEDGRAAPDVGAALPLDEPDLRRGPLAFGFVAAESLLLTAGPPRRFFLLETAGLFATRYPLLLSPPEPKGRNPPKVGALVAGAGAGAGAGIGAGAGAIIGFGAGFGAAFFAFFAVFLDFFFAVLRAADFFLLLRAADLRATFLRAIDDFFDFFAFFFDFFDFFAMTILRIVVG